MKMAVCELNVFMRPSFNKKLMIIEIQLAYIKVKIYLHFEETKRYFRNFIINEECENWDIRIDEEDIMHYPSICPSGKLEPFSEAYLLIPCVSTYLLKHNCAVIHGVSFVWHHRSWLITAPSGTGKTTQFHHWLNLFGEEISLINGDKTILSVNENGEIWLYPSPWTGKEGETGDSFAPLGGIIVLRQTEHNSIKRMAPHESVLEIYQQFLNSNETPEEIYSIGKLTEILLDNIPIWLLENRGDKESAILTYQTLLQYEEEKNENN